MTGDAGWNAEIGGRFGRWCSRLRTVVPPDFPPLLASLRCVQLDSPAPRTPQRGNGQLPFSLRLGARPEGLLGLTLNPDGRLYPVSITPVHHKPVLKTNTTSRALAVVHADPHSELSASFERYDRILVRYKIHAPTEKDNERSPDHVCRPRIVGSFL